MTITCTIDGTPHPARIASPSATFATVETACPHCEHDPLRASGHGVCVDGHAAYTADAFCFDCGKRVGTLRVQVSTIFGIEEEERVMSGPWKVY